MDRPLRIGLDAREGFRENPRGIGLYARHLWREFGAIGGDFEFLLYHERPRPADLPPIPESCRPVRFTVRGSRWQAWERFALPGRLRRDRIDLYHGTYNSLPPRPWFRPSLKMVVTMHDVVVTWLRADESDPWVRYVKRKTPGMLARADAVVTVSAYSKGEIEDRFQVPSSRIRVLHNGVDPVFLEDGGPGGEDRLQRLRGEGPYLFAIGSALDRKNSDLCFPLLRRLSENPDLRDLRLVMSGLEGEALERRRRAASEAGVADRVRFLGYLTKEELRELYRGAEVFVYPSRVEGWGIPILEAMACGTRVAASRGSGMEEAAGGLAWLFDPEDPDSIVEALRAALDGRDDPDPERRKGRERARSFTWRRHAEGLCALYRELCG